MSNPKKKNLSGKRGSLSSTTIEKTIEGVKLLVEAREI